MITLYKIYLKLSKIIVPQLESIKYEHTLPIRTTQIKYSGNGLLRHDRHENTWQHAARPAATCPTSAHPLAILAPNTYRKKKEITDQ